MGEEGRGGERRGEGKSELLIDLVVATDRYMSLEMIYPPRCLA
jgi:hypothetical protein